MNEQPINPLNNPVPPSLSEQMAKALTFVKKTKANGRNKVTLAKKLKQRSKSKQNQIKKRARKLAKQLNLLNN